MNMMDKAISEKPCQMPIQSTNKWQRKEISWIQEEKEERDLNKRNRIAEVSVDEFRRGLFINGIEFAVSSIAIELSTHRSEQLFFEYSWGSSAASENFCHLWIYIDEALDRLPTHITNK